MNEFKIKLKLPSEVVVNIPTFSDITLESCFKVAMNDGVKLIESVLAREIAQEILKKHRKKFKGLVTKGLFSVEDEIVDGVLKAIRKNQ